MVRGGRGGDVVGGVYRVFYLFIGSEGELFEVDMSAHRYIIRSHNFGSLKLDEDVL